jgi:GH35 family endo-1,4-beta-xylanase
MDDGGERCPCLPETLLKRIETHVTTVVKRYADVVTMWDVVNEAVADGNDYSDHNPVKRAKQYLELFKVFVENSDMIPRVSFWNLHDEESWLNNFPWKRVNHPLLFDRQRQPKPAFDLVYRYLSTTGK